MDAAVLRKSAPTPREQDAIIAFRQQCAEAEQARAAAIELRRPKKPPREFGCSLGACDVAQLRFSSHDSLCEHLRDSHRQLASLQTLSFTSMAAFDQWRAVLTERDMCSFVAARGKKQLEQFAVQTLVCSRSADSHSVARVHAAATMAAAGAPAARASSSSSSSSSASAASSSSPGTAGDSTREHKQELLPAKRPNRVKESKKLPYMCAARINVREERSTGRVTVVFMPAHSHELYKGLHLKFQKLPAQDVALAKQLLDMHVDRSEVLKTLRGPLAHWRNRDSFDRDCTRSTFATRQDVDNARGCATR